MKAAPVAAAKSRLRKIERSSIGALPRCSIRTKSGSRTAATIEAADHQRVVPAGDAAARDPVDEAGEADDEGDRAAEVEAADGVAAGQLAQDQAPPRAPPASASGTLNQKTQCQEIATRAPPSTGPMHEPDRGDHRVRAHRQAELLAREGVGDQGGAVGEDEGAADPLQDPPEDQLGAVGGEAGAERGGAKTTKAPTKAVLRPKRSERRPAVRTSTVEEIM